MRRSSDVGLGASGDIERLTLELDAEGTSVLVTKRDLSILRRRVV